MSAVVKPKRCRICRRPFEPRNTLQACCSSGCAITYARLGGEKRQSAAMKRVQAAEKREAKERLRSRRDWIKIAQEAFNAFVRYRDADLPCVSCGAQRGDDEVALGGGWDCGHYRTVAAAPQHRFNPLNAAKQCKSCNSGVIRSRSGVRAVHDIERGTTIRAAFRRELVKRIGADAVDALERDNRIHRHTVDELKEIVATYRGELRAMRKQRAA